MLVIKVSFTSQKRIKLRGDLLLLQILFQSVVHCPTKPSIKTNLHTYTVVDFPVPLVIVIAPKNGHFHGY